MKNRTIKTVRDFKYLILTFVNIIIIFLVTIYYEKIKSVEYQFTGQEEYNDVNVAEFYKNQESQLDIYTNVLFISILISIFITLYEFNAIRRSSIKWLFIVWVIYIISALVDFGTHSNSAEFIFKENKEYLWSYFLFFPHLIFILQYTIIGKKIDITNEIEEKENLIKDSQISNLDSLYTSGILSEIEFNEKKEQVVKDKIKVDIKKTKEYDLLVSTKNTGLLTDKEFENKLNILIEKTFNEIDTK